MRSMMRKTTVREIRHSIGRYIAILAIVALGVGFYSGLTVTKSAMIKTADTYLNSNSLFDFRLISTLGFTDENVEAISQSNNIRTAVGAVYTDFLFTLDDNDNERVIKAHSLTQNINTPALVCGNMPQNANECIADYRAFSEKDIGSYINVTDTNTDSTKSALSYKEYKIVGIASSPYYLNFERGNTAIGNGSVFAYIYLLPDGFNTDYYSEIFVVLNDTAQIFSDEYKALIDKNKDSITNLCNTLVQKRYEDILFLTGSANNTTQIQKPECYILDRTTNIGYACFENDSSIVEGIAAVFPLFFFLVAALVCATTMNRMIDEQRTQIGIFKALGYSKFSIMQKYIFYSGSASVIGCIIGFNIGSYVFPKVIWTAYDIMYGFAQIEFVLNMRLAIISLAVSLLCSVGTTILTCYGELNNTCALLMRPKAPKKGKRIFLEHIPFIWNRIKFLRKVTIRNMFRYKKRFFMMIIGISGCTALLLTGFGIKDSINDIADKQFDKIEIYDCSASLKQSMSDKETVDFKNKFLQKIDSAFFVCETNADITIDSTTKTVKLIIPQNSENIENFINFTDTNGNKISYPNNNEAIINSKLAQQLSLNVGDIIEVYDADINKLSLKISGIFENYVYNYIYISSSAYSKPAQGNIEYKTVYINTSNVIDTHSLSVELMNYNNISSVSVNSDIRERVTNMMSSLNYIVIFLTLCAGALAFIVIYNLTNINITERIREIATVKVLGFNTRETGNYVFRENIILSVIGSFVGILLGTLLHSFVMSQINIDLVSFDIKIKLSSYFAGIALTLLFTFIINNTMYIKLEKINMAEALKSVE